LDSGKYITDTYPRGYPKPDWDYEFYASGISIDDDGNGTWQHAGLALKNVPGSNNDNKAYSGYEGHVEWVSTVEEYWVLVTIFDKNPGPPSVPMNLAVAPIPGGDALEVTWDLNTDDTISYEIHWKNPISGNWELVFNQAHPGNSIIFSNPLLVNNNEYSFKIRALDETDLFSPFSNIVTVIHKDQLPPKPPDYLKAVTINESKIKLIWNRGTDNDIEGYDIFINYTPSWSGGPYKFYERVNSVNYTLHGLEENTSYYFVISAFDEANNPSHYSMEAWNTTAPAPKPPEQPRIIKTFPENNSTNVPVNISVILTFSLSMDIESISVEITPTIEFIHIWIDQNRVLYVDFMGLLSSETEYIIRINDGEGKDGRALLNTPFVLKFRTSKVSVQEPDEPEIDVNSPTKDDIVNPGSTITVTGNSTGFEENTEIFVLIDGKIFSGKIDDEGNWNVDILIPDDPGIYNITVTAGNHSYWFKITVDEKPDDDEIEDDDEKSHTEPEDKSKLSTAIIISIIIIIVIFLILYFIIIKKKSMENVIEPMDQEKSMDEHSKTIENNSLQQNEVDDPLYERD
jgi:hypothetical protein